MKSLIASRQEIVLELTEDQSRQIERATGKLVTELQVEIVGASKSLDGLEPNCSSRTTKTQSTKEKRK